MPDIVRILKEEISRLSRKEAKQLTAPFRKRIIVLSRTVSRVKQTMTELDRKIALLERRMEEFRSPRISAAPEVVKKSRVSSRLIKIQRKRLQLNQEKFAKLLGVSVATVRSWEQGRSSPRGPNLSAFVGIRRLKRTEAYRRLEIKPKRQKGIRRQKSS